MAENQDTPSVAEPTDATPEPTVSELSEQVKAATKQIDDLSKRVSDKDQELQRQRDEKAILEQRLADTRRVQEQQTQTGTMESDASRILAKALDDPETAGRELTALIAQETNKVRQESLGVSATTDSELDICRENQGTESRFARVRT